jgi:hypothetical protein
MSFYSEKLDITPRMNKKTKAICFLNDSRGSAEEGHDDRNTQYSQLRNGGNDAMRKKLSLVFLAVSILTLVPVMSVNANPILRTTMSLDFYGVNPIWRGSVSGDINGFMDFTNVGSGKGGNQEAGNTIHFGEIWQIWSDDFLLRGTDKGVVSLGNSKYRMNGIVTEAEGIWAHLVGHRVHMSGTITWDPDTGAPLTAPGIFQVTG